MEVSRLLHIPAAFPLGQRPPTIHKIGEWLGLTVSLDLLEKRKTLVPVPTEKNPGLFSEHLRRHTKCRSPPPCRTALSTKICRRPCVLGREVSYALENIQLNFLGKQPRYYKESSVNVLFVHEASFRCSANFLLASAVRSQIRSFNKVRGKILDITVSKMTGL